MATVAALISRLEEQKVDPSLLLFLQAGDEIIKRKEWLAKLQEMVGGITVNHSFYRAIEAHLRTSGIRPITPNQFVYALKKKKVKELYDAKRKEWGVHNPFFFQTYSLDADGNYTNLVFYITRTAADGLIRLLELLTSREVVLDRRVYRVVGAFEHVLHDQSLCYPIMDCEIMQEFFGGRMTGAQIEALLVRFPEVLLARWSARRLINPHYVGVVTKHKSRATGRGFKVSMHFIPKVLSVKQVHSAAFDSFLQTEDEDRRLEDWAERPNSGQFSAKSWIDAATKAAKDNGGVLPESFPVCFPLGVDAASDERLSTFAFDYQAGRYNGFSTAFSRKKSTDPFSTYLGCFDYWIEEKLREESEPCPLPAPHDIEGAHLSQRDRLWILYSQCYTVGQLDSVVYDEAFVRKVLAAADPSDAVSKVLS